MARIFTKMIPQTTTNLGSFVSDEIKTWFLDVKSQITSLRSTTKHDTILVDGILSFLETYWNGVAALFFTENVDISEFLQSNVDYSGLALHLDSVILFALYKVKGYDAGYQEAEMVRNRFEQETNRTINAEKVMVANSLTSKHMGPTGKMIANIANRVAQSLQHQIDSDALAVLFESSIEMLFWIQSCPSTHEDATPNNAIMCTVLILQMLLNNNVERALALSLLFSAPNVYTPNHSKTRKKPTVTLDKEEVEELNGYEGIAFHIYGSSSIGRKK